jgi:hypothetical protein
MKDEGARMMAQDGLRVNGLGKSGFQKRNGLLPHIG